MHGYFTKVHLLFLIKRILPVLKVNYPLMYKENVIWGAIMPIQGISMNGKNPELIPNETF